MYNRPNLPYEADSLPNSNRYALLAAKKQPPTAAAVDSDINYIVDSLNDLDDKIGDIEAGVLVGANNPENAGLFVTTDGNEEDPTILWKKVDNTNVVPGSLTTACFTNEAVTNDKLGVACVETKNLSPNCVTSPTIAPRAILSQHIKPEAVTTPAIKDRAIVTAKIDNRAVKQENLDLVSVGTPQLIDANVTQEKLALISVGTEQLINKAVTTAKIGSEASLANTFLAADGTGNASFIDKIGRILQIVSYENAKYVLNEYNAAATPQTPLSFQSGAFALNITPKKTGSKILLYYSINLGGYRLQYNSVVLCKNDAVFKKGDDSSPAFIGLTHCYYGNEGSGAGYGSNEFGASIYSNLFVDTGTQDVQIVYEIKKAHPYTVLNGGFSQSFPSISTMVAVEIDI